MAILLASVTAFATFLGGLLAVKSKGHLHLVLGLSGGLLLGLVAFDLIPEVFELSNAEVWHTPAVMLCFVGGFLLLHVFERFSGTHERADSEYEATHQHAHSRIGAVAALGMTGHVFMDGLGIGLAFQVSHSLGWLVAAAVTTHAFTDGLNTVSLLIRSKHWQKKALLLLGADAVARITGAFLGSKIAISNNFLGLYLAIFSGFLIYLATSHILPEAHSKHPSRLTLLMTVLGTTIMFVIVNLLHE
ncbi:MAG: divalent heavy-metal cations transporter [Actinobacteria bacterium]|uniref:Unannotated protein n=1 Tax=freshwater metagenome TaxID=449393 RepID=A0A6J5YVG2_9ZZZZ|nr:divalent heavy-metal cations transporter [Actinomycetota bacterium]